MKRLANGQERDPICSCHHGPAVHRNGHCVFAGTCGCRIWNPVPYVYDEVCTRCEVLEAALRALGSPVQTVPAQRQPTHWEQRAAQLRTTDREK